MGRYDGLHRKGQACAGGLWADALGGFRDQLRNLHGSDLWLGEAGFEAGKFQHLLNQLGHAIRLGVNDLMEAGGLVLGEALLKGFDGAAD